MKKRLEEILPVIRTANTSGRIYSLKFVKDDGSIREATCKWTSKYDPPTDHSRAPRTSTRPPVQFCDLDIVRQCAHIMNLTPETDVRLLPHPRRSFRPERLLSAKADGELYEVELETKTGGN